jgi:hypothetical protein
MNQPKRPQHPSRGIPTSSSRNRYATRPTMVIAAIVAALVLVATW